jgi:hypothetical protein
MTISDKDIKKLWGLAAGRCSKPGCDEQCIKFLTPSDAMVIGEMAHVIARKADGPRGIPGGGDDTYENLILLCPTHHREVDKAPEYAYPATLLLEWKKHHEEHVQQAFLSPRYSNRTQLGTAIKKLLIRNKAIWQQCGPESDEAKRNPLSNLHEFWELKKLDTIVPNNRKIKLIIEQNHDFFEVQDFETCAQFIQHAEAFERSCYARTEGVPRFPKAFEEVINLYAGF